MSLFAKQVLLAGFTVISLSMAASQASAQGASQSCQDVQKYLEDRKSLVAQLNKSSSSKKSVDPKLACSIFTKLSANGNATLKWLDENKAWCEVPDDFIDGFKKDHEQVSKLRGQACKVAAQMDAAQKQAQEGSNPAWGGGLSGQYRMPKGAIQ